MNITIHGLPYAVTTTAKDTDGTLALETVGILTAAYNLRRSRRAMIDDATARYGWTGPCISGCEEDHWPDDVKD